MYAWFSTAVGLGIDETFLSAVGQEEIGDPLISEVDEVDNKSNDDTSAAALRSQSAVQTRPPEK